MGQNKSKNNKNTKSIKLLNQVKCINQECEYIYKSAKSSMCPLCGESGPKYWYIRIKFQENIGNKANEYFAKDNLIKYAKKEGNVVVEGSYLAYIFDNEFGNSVDEFKQYLTEQQLATNKND